MASARATKRATSDPTRGSLAFAADAAAERMWLQPCSGTRNGYGRACGRRSGVRAVASNWGESRSAHVLGGRAHRRRNRADTLPAFGHNGPRGWPGERSSSEVSGSSSRRRVRQRDNSRGRIISTTSTAPPQCGQRLLGASATDGGDRHHPRPGVNFLLPDCVPMKEPRP